MNRGRRRTVGRLAVAGITVITVITAAGCTSRSTAPHRSTRSPSATATTGHATIGALAITGAYIRQPASPDVAAAYLTITNTGATPDTITKVTTDVTASVMTMTETDHDGVGTMTNLDHLSVPAHGRVALTPGHAHLMLQRPSTRLRAGAYVDATVTFAHAGTVTIAFPVRPS